MKSTRPGYGSGADGTEDGAGAGAAPPVYDGG